MKVRNYALAASLAVASMSSFATTDFGFDYSNPNLDPNTGNVNDLTNPVNAAIDDGWYIWANEDYSNLYLAWSDFSNGSGGQTYSQQIVANDNLDSPFSTLISVENGGNVLQFGGTVQVTQEWVINGVDIIELNFDPAISLTQDIEFWLSSTNGLVNECSDFTTVIDVDTSPGSDCIGDTVESKNINIWDNGIGGFTTDFNVELQNFTDQTIDGFDPDTGPIPSDTNGTVYFSQNFQLTRVSTPSVLAFLGLGLIAITLRSRRK